MDVNTIIQLITSVGFPIVMCIAMAWYVKYCTDKSRDEVARLNVQHESQMREFTTAINNNTVALTKLCEKMDQEM